MTPCPHCSGSGEDKVAEVIGLGTMPCQVCRGKGRLSRLDRLVYWNDTNPAGSFPERFRCELVGHDWDRIETLAYCARCHAVWDCEREEAIPPARMVRRG